MNEGIYDGEPASQGVANHAGPGWPIDLSAAGKVDHVSDDGKPGHDQSGGDQPDREPLPQHIRHLPVDKIGDQRAGEIGDGKPRGHAVNRSSAIPPDWSRIVTSYQRRFPDRSVLLHVSILMTIGCFCHDPILVLLCARAFKFGFNFAKPVQTILNECHSAHHPIEVKRRW
jgi:hypothetical protein